MHSLTFFSIISLGLAAFSLASNSTHPQVDLGYARFQGIHNETLGINTFYGLRFAAPPTGQLRWRQAIPVEKQNNYTHGQLVDASIPGPQCQQVSGASAAAFEDLIGAAFPGLPAAEAVVQTPRNDSEDCLRLDVIVPTKPKSSSLPVVIQIHGGGYTTGNSQTSDGSSFTSYAQGNIVWVQIQYRLNLYGFLGAKEVLSDGDPNIGLTDQRVAFDWVQRHIQTFGGDPNRVTIWGGSAGGGSVANHLIINASVPNPPFHAAIAEYPWFQPYHEQEVLELQYQQLLNTSGCANVACLRALPEETLANATLAAQNLAQAEHSVASGDSYYGPYVDGTIIRDFPSNEFERGNFHKVPLLTDRDGFEGLIFQNDTANSTADTTADLQILMPAARQAFFTRLYQLYELSSFAGSYFDQPFFSSKIFQVLSSAIPQLKLSSNDAQLYRVSQIFGDIAINCPTYTLASGASAAGVNVWKLICSAGTYIHGATGAFILAPSADSISGNATVSNFMKDWFLSFVLYQDPNTMASLSNTTRPTWPQYLQPNDTRFTVMQVNETDVAPQADTDASDRCDFLHAQNNIVRN